MLPRRARSQKLRKWRSRGVNDLELGSFEIYLRPDHPSHISTDTCSTRYHTSLLAQNQTVHLDMTRVTAFGFPKKGNTASTWDELTGQAGGDAESSSKGAERQQGEADKKRKRREDKGGEGEGNGRAGGWGRNEDVKRTPLLLTSTLLTSQLTFSLISFHLIRQGRQIRTTPSRPDRDQELFDRLLRLSIQGSRG